MRKLSHYLLGCVLTVALIGMFAAYSSASAASTPHLVAEEEFQMSLYPFRMEGNSFDNYIRKFECSSTSIVKVKLLRIVEGQAFSLWDGQHHKKDWTPPAEVCLLSLLSGNGLENNSQVDFGFSENEKAGVSRSFPDNSALPDTLPPEAGEYADFEYSVPEGTEIVAGSQTMVYWKGRILFQDLTANFALRSINQLTEYSASHAGTTFLAVTLQPVDISEQR